jgi:hypothetical protein
MLLFFLFLLLLVVGGLSFLLAHFFTDEKCTGCGNYGDTRHMMVDLKGRHWHYDCYEDDNVG